MYVVMNRLTVAPEQADHLEEGFAHSAGRMRAVPGCLNFNLLKEEGIAGDTVYVALTQWEDEAAFTAWTESESFRRARERRAGRRDGRGPCLYRDLLKRKGLRTED